MEVSESQGGRVSNMVTGCSLLQYLDRRCGRLPSPRRSAQVRCDGEEWRCIHQRRGVSHEDEQEDTKRAVQGPRPGQSCSYRRVCIYLKSKSIYFRAPQTYLRQATGGIC